MISISGVQAKDVTVKRLSVDLDKIKSYELSEIISRSEGDRPLLVLLWAESCEPCFLESGLVKTIAERFKDQVDFISLYWASQAVKSSAARVRKYVTKTMMPKLQHFKVNRLNHPEAFLVSQDVKASRILHTLGVKRNLSNIYPQFILLDRSRSRVLFHLKGSILESYDRLKGLMDTLEPYLSR